GHRSSGVICAVAPRMVAFTGLDTRMAIEAVRQRPRRWIRMRLRYSPTSPRPRSFQLLQLRPPSRVRRIMALRSDIGDVQGNDRCWISVAAKWRHVLRPRVAIVFRHVEPGRPR